MSQPHSSSGNKQSSCLVAAGVGCLGIILLGGVAIVGFGYAGYRGFHSIAKTIGTDARTEAVTMVLEAIPLVKIVKVDDAAHLVTISRLNSAEEERISFEDAMAGKFRITDGKRRQVMVNAQERAELSGPEGQKIVVGSIADTVPPAWIPAHGERDPGGINVRVENGKIVSGVYTTHTADSPEAVKNYFDKAFTDGNYTRSSSWAKFGDSERAVMQATEGPRKIKVAAISEGKGKTTVWISYEGPKP